MQPWHDVTMSRKVSRVRKLAASVNPEPVHVTCERQYMTKASTKEASSMTASGSRPRSSHDERKAVKTTTTASGDQEQKQSVKPSQAKPSQAKSAGYTGMCCHKVGIASIDALL